MKPIDFRNETFKQLEERLNPIRMAVYNAWLEHGPGTTRQVADRSGIDLLTLRPRTTELYQMGLVVPHEIQDQRPEGVYRVRPLGDWPAWHADEIAKHVSGQQQLL